MTTGKFFEKIFGLDKLKFSEVVINRSVIDSIVDLARGSYPNEFIALLQGNVKNKKLIIDGLVYQPYDASRISTIMKMNVPSLSRVVGSVHSHPSKSGPSSTDLLSFNKRGAIHLIIGYPYSVKDINCYDFEGNKLEFGVDKNN